MTESGYRAFISYSHRDAMAAQALHRRLEAYRIPRRLAGTSGEHGLIPRRLTPIFRDRDELPAAGDLSEKVRAALAASNSLIILCSPHAAASLWVSREIELFRALHPGRPVLAAILDGEPADCFPAALRGLQADGTPIEPLAADLRRSGDGRRLGFLKLVAGMTGVGLDALVQRDAARTIRRVTAVTLAALATTVLMTMLTLVALNARHEADRQRGEAEGLVEFMLTDLRTKLKGVGRLDVLDAVNRRALDHYSRQNIAELSPDALERRASILHAMGEDDEKRDDLSRAIAEFREAARTTAALLAADPDNTDRIFMQSQSEYWIGSVDYHRARYPAAKSAFQRYRALTDRLIAIDPHRTDWMREAAYADGNLCAIALKPPVDVESALATCGRALKKMEAAAHNSSHPKAFHQDIANRLGFHADALSATGDLAGALAVRRRQLSLVDAQLTEDPQNAHLLASRAWSLRAIAHIRNEQGHGEDALALLTRAAAIVDGLSKMDRQNRELREDLKKIKSELDELNKGDLQ